MCMNHLRKPARNILICRTISTIKTLRRVNAFMLNKVRTMPLTAAKILVEVGISRALLPMLYRNHVDILYTKPVPKIAKATYNEMSKNTDYPQVTKRLTVMP